MQVDTADELMSVELMFNAVWNKLDKHKLVALLSCLIPCFEKDEEQQGLPVELAEAVSSLQAFATEVATVTTVRSIHTLVKESFVTINADMKSTCMSHVAR